MGRCACVGLNQEPDGARSLVPGVKKSGPLVGRAPSKINGRDEFNGECNTWIRSQEQEEGRSRRQSKAMALSSREKKTAAAIVSLLDMQRHPDGGFYLETFRDPSITLPKSALRPRCKPGSFTAALSVCAGFLISLWTCNFFN